MKAGDICPTCKGKGWHQDDKSIGTCHLCNQKGVLRDSDLRRFNDLLKEYWTDERIKTKHQKEIEYTLLYLATHHPDEEVAKMALKLCSKVMSKKYHFCPEMDFLACEIAGPDCFCTPKP